MKRRNNKRNHSRKITTQKKNGTKVAMDDKYKDRVFRMLFNNKKNLLSLYNAFNGTDYKNENEIEINTLENAIYLSKKNDVSFIFRFSLNIFEHQSTPNPNLPLRDLYYVTDMYNRDHAEDDIYSSRILKIKAPYFIVLYNGTERLEEKFEYKLSDMFEQKTENPALELKIMVYNINRGMNEDIKNACKALKEYMILVDEIRDNLKAKMHKNDAINKAINDCINNNVLKGFLLRNREAVMHSCLYEYDEEKHIKNEKNISFEEGKEEGKSEEKRESVLRMLKRHKDIEEIAGDLDVSIDYIKQIEAELLAKA